VMRGDEKKRSKKIQSERKTGCERPSRAAFYNVRKLPCGDDVNKHLVIRATLPQDLSRVVARERAEAKPLRVSFCAKPLRVIDTAY
jgi:hypothetical protein